MIFLAALSQDGDTSIFLPPKRHFHRFSKQRQAVEKFALRGAIPLETERIVGGVRIRAGWTPVGEQERVVRADAQEHRAVLQAEEPGGAAVELLTLNGGTGVHALGS